MQCMFCAAEQQEAYSRHSRAEPPACLLACLQEWACGYLVSNVGDAPTCTIPALPGVTNITGVSTIYSRRGQPSGSMSSL